MAVIDAVAKEFHMKTGDLLKESLKTYLEQRLANVEAELFSLAKKHGVRDVFELDARIKSGFVGEKEAYDDYFALDNLQAEREKIKKFIEEI